MVWVLVAGCAAIGAAQARSQDRAKTPHPHTDAVRAAIEDGIRARMGREARVRIEQLDIRVSQGMETGTWLAVPEPGARLEQPMRFTLTRHETARVDPDGRMVRPAFTRQVGHAVATVFVSIEHVRAGRPLARGETCEAGDVATSRDVVGSVLVQKLPRMAEMAGARWLRDLAAGEVVTRAVAAVAPMVKSGDIVLVRAAAEGVLVEAQAVAAQNGGPGDVIRVVNRESRRTVRARVVGPGEVEVVR